MKCPNCNSEIKDDDIFCSECGAKLTAYMPTNVKSGGLKTAQIIIIIALAAVLLGLIAVILKLTIFNMPEEHEPAPTDGAEITLNVIDSGSASVTESETPTETAAPPVFTEIEVSSTRSIDISERTGERVDYKKEYLMDGILTNCWTPDRHIDTAPYIILKAQGMQRVHGLKFTDGYFKSMETYSKNRRISKVEIVYNGGSIIYECTEHTFGKMQDVVFAAPIDTDFIQIKILDSLYGDWQDICVSEIEVY